MSIFESIVDSLKSQIERQAPEAVDIEKSKADVLNDSITTYLNQKKATPEVVEEQPETTPETEINKGRKYKSKGIALTAAAQGGPANGRSVSLLMKSLEQPTIKRQQLISKASVPVFIRKANGELLSPTGQLITESLMKTIRKLNIDFTIQEEQSKAAL